MPSRPSAPAASATAARRRSATCTRRPSGGPAPPARTAIIVSTVGAPRQKCVTPSSRSQPPDLRGVDGAQADVGAAGGGHRPGEAPAVAVEHRQRPQVAAVRGQPGVEGHGQRLQVGAAVVVHHALGRPVVPAGVVDRQQAALVLGGDGRRLGGRRAAARTRSPGHDQPARRCAPPPARRPSASSAVATSTRGPGVLDDVRQLGRRQPGVERHQHRAAQRDPVVQLEHHVAVGAQRRDPVARARRRAPRARRSGARPGRPNCGVGEPAVAVDDRRPVAEHQRGAGRGTRSG